MASDPTSGPEPHAERAAAVLSIDLRQAWPVLMARAVLAVALGLVMLTVPGVTLLLVAWAFGIYALVDGAAQVLDAIRRRHRPRWWIALLLGLIGVVAGDRADLAVPHRGRLGSAGRVLGTGHRGHRDRQRGAPTP